MCLQTLTRALPANDQRVAELLHASDVGIYAVAPRAFGSRAWLAQSTEDSDGLEEAQHDAEQLARERAEAGHLDAGSHSGGSSRGSSGPWLLSEAHATAPPVATEATGETVRLISLLKRLGPYLRLLAPLLDSGPSSSPAPPTPHAPVAQSTEEPMPKASRSEIIKSIMRRL